MTKKRYRKLARAYLTRLNEWAKANNSTQMNMGKMYKIISQMDNPKGMTRAEWWEIFSKEEVFGVGVKAKKQGEGEEV